MIARISLCLLLGLIGLPLEAPAKEQSLPTTTISLPDGSQLIAEIARTPEQRALGLMDRSELPLDRGMLFIFESEDVHGIWMKRTWISLDILYLTENQRISAIFESIPRTFSTTPEHLIPKIRSKGLYVLELAAGAKAHYGLSVGDKLSFSLSE